MSCNRVTPHDSSALPFDPEPSSCQLDWGLYCVAEDARMGIDEGPRAIELAQLALDIEKLRRKHAEHCPECNPETAP
jgi:hypothetical protein